MRLPCWLVGHRRKPETRFIRRLDGYPLAAYGECHNCDKRLNMTDGRPGVIEPPFDAALAAKWAKEFSEA